MPISAFVERRRVASKDDTSFAEFFHSITTSKKKTAFSVNEGVLGNKILPACKLGDRGESSKNRISSKLLCRYVCLMAFRITALDRRKFEHLFLMSDAELTAFRAVRMTVDKKPGYPCRVSLADAEVGEEVILVNYEHLPNETPFRASHAIYLRTGVTQAQPEANELPEMLTNRVLSLRGFQQEGMLIAAELVNGPEVRTAIETMFANTTVSFVHLHFAKPGCYAARADRA